MRNKSLNQFKDLFTNLIQTFFKNKDKNKSQKFIIFTVTFTDVAKLVDALDLGPSDICFESSSLSIRNFFYN